MFGRVLVAASCAVALSACSVPAGPQQPEPSGSVPVAPVACTDPVFTWSDVQASPGLGALGQRLDLTAGQKSPVALEPVLTGATVQVVPQGLEPETVLTALDRELDAGDPAEYERTARPGEALLDVTGMEITAANTGTYVGYKAVSFINASFTYTCAPGAPAQSGTVSTWSDMVTGVIECGQEISDSRTAVVAYEAAKARCP
jgi:hypothetical protein